MWRQHGGKHVPKPSRITIRFTVEEMGKLISRARSRNISLAAYCRDILMNRQPKDKSEDEKRFRRVAAGEANNLNQLATEMHTRGLVPDLLSRIEALITKIENA